MMDSSGKIKTAIYQLKFPLLVASVSFLGIINPAVAQQGLPYSAAPYVATPAGPPTQSGIQPMSAIQQQQQQRQQQPQQHRMHHTANADETTTTDLTQTEGPVTPTNINYQPAVAYINGWLRGSVGGWHSLDNSNVAFLPPYWYHGHNTTNGASLVADGGFTMPLTYRFGIQMDAFDGVIAHDNLFAANGYIFWRNPCLAEVAFHYRYADVDHVYANLYGLHGEGYYYNFTGIIEGGSIHTNTRGGNGYGELMVAWYANPNWRFDLGYLNVAGRQSGQLGSEYQLGFFPTVPGISAFGAVGGGNRNLYYGYVGLKVYFGCNKSLLQRHREDTLDPSYDLTAIHQIETLG